MLRTFGAVLIAAMLSTANVYAADLDAPHPLNSDQQNDVDEMYPVDPNPDVLNEAHPLNADQQSAVDDMYPVDPNPNGDKPLTEDQLSAFVDQLN